MYNRSKVLLVSLLILLAMQIVAETIILGPIVARMRSSWLVLPELVIPADICVAVTLLPQFPGCIPTNPSTHTWAYWVPMLAVESILFLLASVKAFDVARKNLHTPKILAVLLRDSILYFGGVMAIILANLMIWSLARVCRDSLAFPLVQPNALLS